MPNRLLRVMLFLSSYSPLGVIFIYLNSVKKPIPCMIVLLAITTGLIGLLTFAYKSYRTDQTTYPIKIKAVHAKDGETVSYIMTYIIPFLSFPSNDDKQLIAILFFIVIVCILYVKSNMIHINPILLALGFSTFEVTTDKGNVYFLITRKKYLELESFVSVFDVDVFIRMEVSVAKPIGKPRSN